MEKDWLTALGRMTYGIYVLTCQSDKIINGMIASWVTQVSYDPPLIMVAVHPNRYSHGLIEKNPVMALHVIDKSQKDLLKRFKGPVLEQKFHEIAWENKKTGVPVLKSCLAWVEMTVKEQMSPGNHTLFIGEVVNAGVNDPDTIGIDIIDSGTPLCTLDYDGMYTGKS